MGAACLNCGLLCSGRVNLEPCGCQQISKRDPERGENQVAEGSGLHSVGLKSLTSLHCFWGGSLYSKDPSQQVTMTVVALGTMGGGQRNLQGF